LRRLIMSARTKTTGSVREIDTGRVRQRYARGWHWIGTGEEFSGGQPHLSHAISPKRGVGTGTAGEISVRDGYCRHLSRDGDHGGDVCDGEVKDGNIACPFHDWRWGGGSKGKGIPYAKRVPLRAKTRAWSTMRQSGLVFVWHDHEGNPPREEDAIPALPEYES